MGKHQQYMQMVHIYEQLNNVMKKILFFLFVPFFCSSQLTIQDTTKQYIDAIIMIGQSNMVGGNTTGTTSPTYTVPQSNTYIYTNKDLSSANMFQPLTYPINQNWYSAVQQYNGQELSFGYNYNLQTGKKIIIIKYAYAGSMMVDTGGVWVNGLWQWNANLSNCNGYPHYNNLMNYFIYPCIAQCKAQNIKLNVKSISIVQGETDAAYYTCATNWETVTISLIDKIKSELNTLGVLSPNFKPIIFRTNYQCPRTYLSQLRTAQQNVANHYGTTYIDTDSYPIGSDNVHWTKTAQDQAGLNALTKFLLIP